MYHRSRDHRGVHVFWCVLTGQHFRPNFFADNFGMVNVMSKNLGSIPLFTGLPAKDLRVIEKHSDRVTIPAGGSFIRQGSMGFECFVLLTGRVEAFRDGLSVAVFESGDLVGEVGPLTRSPRSATVVASELTELLVFTGQGLDTVLYNVPVLAQRIVRSVLVRYGPGAAF